MPQLDQRGFVAQLLILLLLVAGIGSGVYLVKSGNLKLFSGAANPPIVFKSLDGKPLPVNKKGIPQTMFPTVRVELTSTLGPPVPISGPIRRGTVAYRVAFNPADLNSAPFVPYLTEPTVYNVGFRNTPEIQFYWVEFKAADGKVDRRSAQIEMVYPEMVYPQNGQTIDLEGAYMFKVKLIKGASGYMFGLFQNGVMIFENHPLSLDGEFALLTTNPAHAKFQPGEVRVMIRALINNQWTVAREITITLKPKRPFCKPRPPCLDTTPACKIPEPVESWCPTPTPMSVPTKAL